MKFLSREEFLKLDSGYVYMDYEPHIFGKLSIKEETINIDGKNIDFRFRVLTDIDFDICNINEINSGYNIPIDVNISIREGLFDDNMLYAVLDKKDVHVIINELSASLNLIKEI